MQQFGKYGDNDWCWAKHYAFWPLFTIYSDMGLDCWEHIKGNRLFNLENYDD